MTASSKKRTELLQALETLKDSTCKPGSGCLRYRFFPGAGLPENQDRGRDRRFTPFWRFPGAQFFDAFLLTYSRCFIKKMIGLKAIRSTPDTEVGTRVISCHLRQLSPYPGKFQLSSRYLVMAFVGRKISEVGDRGTPGYRREGQEFFRPRRLDIP